MTVYVRFDQTAKTLGTQGMWGLKRNGFQCDLLNYGPTVYHAIDTRTGDDAIFWNRIDALGIDNNSKMCYTLWLDQINDILPTWIDDTNTRRASINTLAEDSGMWGVLDGMISAGGKQGIYFRVFQVPASICGETDIWESQYRVLEELYTGGWTMMGKFQSFCIDLMYLCYQRYGSTICNKWLWSMGNEVWPDAYYNTSVPTQGDFCHAIWKFHWAITAVWKQTQPNCKTVAIEEVGWGTYHLAIMVNWLNNNRPSENYLKYIDYLSFHSYGGGIITNDQILDAAVTFNTSQLDAVKTPLAAALAYYGEPSSIGFVHGETAIGNEDDLNPVRNMSYLSGVWKTLLIASAAYNDVKYLINWDDCGDPWGFWHTDEWGGEEYGGYINTPLFPSYYGQVTLHEWVRLDPGDIYAVVNSTGGTSVAAPMNNCDQDITVYAFKLANSKNRVICLWNRRGTVQNVSITATLDSAYASGTNVLVQKFVQNSSNANGVLSQSTATASGSSLSLSVSMAAYEFCMLRLSQGFGGAWGGI